jgi:hypothetical protein
MFEVYLLLDGFKRGFWGFGNEIAAMWLLFIP